MTTKSSTHKMDVSMAASKDEMREFFKDSSMDGDFRTMGETVHKAMREDIAEDADPFATIVRNYYAKQCEDVAVPTRVRDGNEMIRNFKQVVVKRIPFSLAEFVKRDGKDESLCVSIIPWLYRLTSGFPTDADRERFTDLFNDDADYFKMLKERFGDNGRNTFLPHLTHTLDIKHPVMLSVIVVRWPKGEIGGRKSNAPSTD